MQRIKSCPVRRRRVAHHVRTSAGGGEVIGGPGVAQAAAISAVAAGKLQIERVAGVAACVFDGTPNAVVVKLAKAGGIKGRAVDEVDFG